MTSRDFAYWLQGFFELTDSDTVTLEQVKMIKNHLNMVFHHDIDKSFGKDLPALKSIHDGVELSSGEIDTITMRANC